MSNKFWFRGKPIPDGPLPNEGLGTVHARRLTQSEIDAAYASRSQKEWLEGKDLDPDKHFSSTNYGSESPPLLSYADHLKRKAQYQKAPPK